MSILKKICGRLLRFLLSEKIPEFAAEMYINLAKNAKTQFYREIAEEIVGRINKRRDVWNLLDIGTGPGFLLFEIAELESDIELVGIDLSEKLIEFAESETEKRDFGDIHFEIGDANHLNFEDESCDFIISSGVLHSLKNPSAAIKELLRVLKPGHDLWIFDPTVLMKVEGDSSRHNKILDDMEKKLTGWKDRLIFRIMRRISNLPSKPMTLDRIYQIILEAGIVDAAAIENRGDYLKIEIIKK